MDTVDNALYVADHIAEMCFWALTPFIGMISGLYPALRAATMIAVQALKYE